MDDPRADGVNTEALVELVGITKVYQGVHALTDVNLRIATGSIHAIVGENGAGKSTLGRIIAGIIRPDSGTLLVGGKPVRYASPHEALREGIASIQQELSLVPQLTVIENVFLGDENATLGLLAHQAMRKRFAELLERCGFSIPPDTVVRHLRIADQQKVEVLRAMARNARLLVIDEPTARLGQDDAQKLVETIRTLRSQGATIVYVSHFLEEVLSLADIVSVLRNGELVGSFPAATVSVEQLVVSMLGRPLTLAFPTRVPPPPGGRTVLRVSDVSRKGVIDGISLTVQAGEIVGLAGLVGSGRSELARVLFGADRCDSGVIEVDGKRVDVTSPRRAIRAGVVMLPESRKDQGLHMRRLVVDNVTLPHLDDVSRLGMVLRSRQRRETRKLLERLDVRPAQPNAKVSNLSGGNQQKVLFAKWLFRQPRLLIADEPTRGVDVGAKIAIYSLIASLAREGLAVLLISSEIEEVLGLSHRILVMRRGRITAEFIGDTATKDSVMQAAFGAGVAS